MAKSTVKAKEDFRRCQKELRDEIIDLEGRLREVSEDERSHGFDDPNPFGGLGSPIGLTQAVLDVRDNICDLTAASSVTKDAERVEDLMAESRRSLEKFVNRILERHLERAAYAELQFKRVPLLRKIDRLAGFGVPRTLLSKMHEVRDVGNKCTHANGKNYSRAYVTGLVKDFSKQVSEYHKRNDGRQRQSCSQPFPSKTNFDNYLNLFP